MLDDTEEYLVRQTAELEDNKTRRAYAFVATIGAHRWGIDLERDAGDQRYAHLNDALEDAMEDLAADGYLGIVGEAVVDGAGELLAIMEDEVGFDVHEPGPLAERVEVDDAPE